jgi:hypothetical protein
MPSDSDVLNLRLRRNDYDTSGDEFVLKANQVERSMSNSIEKAAIIAQAGELAKKEFKFGFEQYTVDGRIVRPDADTYPDGLVSIDTDQYSRAAEKDMAIAEAVRTWGPTAEQGFDRLLWGPRDRTGVISKYIATATPGDTGPAHYAFTLEWDHLTIDPDVEVGGTAGGA